MVNSNKLKEQKKGLLLLSKQLQNIMESVDAKHKEDLKVKKILDKIPDWENLMESDVTCIYSDMYTTEDEKVFYKEINDEIESILYDIDRKLGEE